MPNAVGVRFKRAGHLYFFDAGTMEFAPDDLVVVETARGLEVGRVVAAPKQILEADLPEPLKPVLRLANPDDLRKLDLYRGRESDALAKCKTKIAQHGLPMKLVGAEYSFDGARLVFYFTAESRVDFRELVKDLASTFRTRIELRQIGVRDEAKTIGGIGRCGRALCCASFLSDFEPVSIKMAKDQDLPLNPMKISGLCGRLLCCLGYENAQYCAIKREMPMVGTAVDTAVGPGRVVSLNVLKNTFNVELQSGVTTEFASTDVTISKEQPQPQKGSPPRRRGR